MAIKKQNTKIAPTRKRMILTIVIGIMLVAALLIALQGYRWIFGPNISTPDAKPHYIYLPNKATFDETFLLIERESILKNKKSFLLTVKLMGYSNTIKPGRYKVTDGMSNHELVSLLRSGRQEPVNVTFHEIRTFDRLAQIVSGKTLADSAEIVSLLNDDATITQLGFTKETIIAMFIPNTYQMYWNIEAMQFLERMKVEYNKFWNTERRQRAEQIGLSPIDVSIMASIIDEETNKNDEKATIAGLYLNRIKIGMPLQACPTVKYAMGDFSIKRVLDKDLLIESPYNTYQNKGLPPGPIRMPSISSIDAVLNAESHDYLYMCAKDDFSGYHYFSKTLAQHNRYSAMYSKALSARKIWR